MYCRPSKTLCISLSNRLLRPRANCWVKPSAIHYVKVLLYRISSHSTTPLSTLTSSQRSSPTRPTCAIQVIPVASWTTRRHSRDDPREDVGEDVGCWCRRRGMRALRCRTVSLGTAVQCSACGNASGVKARHQTPCGTVRLRTQRSESGVTIRCDFIVAIYITEF